MMQPFGVPYTQQELVAFEHYFNLWREGEFFPASQAGQLKTSGIPQESLKFIWGSCALSNPIHLTHSEFQRALRMIAMVQQKMDITNPLSYAMYQSLYL